MPEQILAKIKKTILPQWKTCFFTALIVGLIAHLYKIVNWTPNWDSLVFRYDAQDMLDLGRWFLGVVCAPSSFYDLPWLTGLLAIVLHAAGAVCICKMFDVQKHMTAALIGALTISFPTVCSVMMYNYVADGYALSFLLACLAAMLLAKKKPNYIVAILLIVFSVGIYQAYITVTIMLLLCHLILELLDPAVDARTLWQKNIRFLLAGGTGMLLYYLVLRVLLWVMHTELLDYQGVGNAAAWFTITFSDVMYIIQHVFIGYFFDFSKGINVYSVLNCLVVITCLVLYIHDATRRKPHFSKVLLLCIYLLLLPLGACGLAFINRGVEQHNLMNMGFLVFYLFLLLQYEKKGFRNKKASCVKQWAIFVLAILLVFNQVVTANVSYHKLQMAYEKSYGILVRLADRIEQTEGAQDCERILVIGALPESEDYTTDLPPSMTGSTDGLILRADDAVVGQSVVCSALNDYCAKNYTFLVGEEKEELIETAQVARMQNWPAKNSVCVVDDVIVIKLGAER